MEYSNGVVRKGYLFFAGSKQNVSNISSKLLSAFQHILRNVVVGNVCVNN